ncbi:hypothetical protein [Actinophytocola sediminis]
MSVEELLARARAELARVHVRDVDQQRQGGALLVDIRPYRVRMAEGEIADLPSVLGGSTAIS